jgi:hypothetical protein
VARGVKFMDGIEVKTKQSNEKENQPKKIAA